MPTEKQMRKKDRGCMAKKLIKIDNVDISIVSCFHDKTALNTFIAGCTGTLKNNLHLKQPKSLEDAMGYVMEFENFERSCGMLQSERHNTNKINHPNSKSHPFNNDMKPGFNSQFQGTYNPYYNQNQHYFNQAPPYFNQPLNDQQQKPFPSQPINIRPRVVPPQKFLTNRQVFGTQKLELDGNFKELSGSLTPFVDCFSAI
ncbi:hypothetical protein ABEB36_009587 [Hypothenemus hampei]|uniref:Uncharacterized protein n=1 Tax=Hypothenemus hampei TaxID=57062 RepID=A0ABD1EHB4_HYPHA